MSIKSNLSQFSQEDDIQKMWIYPLIIIIVGFCYYISYFNYGISFGDEGFLVDGAERVLRGQLPGSDFMAYPPGRYFLLALLFKLFEVNLWVSRFMEISFLLINGILMFYIGTRLMPPRMALISSFVLMTFPGPWHKVFFTFGLLLPLMFLFRFLEKRTTERVLILGVVTGIGFILNIISALFSLLTIVIILFFDHIWKDGKFFFNKQTFLSLVKNLLLFSLGLLSVTTPILLFYLSKSALGRLLFSLKEAYRFDNAFETTNFFPRPSLLKAITKFHIGSLENLFFYFAILLYLYIFREVFMHLFLQKRKGFPFLLPVLISGCLSLSYAYSFFEKGHFLQSVSMAYIFFGFVMHSATKGWWKKSNVILIFLIFLLSLYIIDNFKWRNYFYSGSIKRLYAIRKEGVGLISSDKAKIYVQLKQSDRINNLLRFFDGKSGYLMPLFYLPMVNFLTGLENPTRFTILFPSLFRNPSKQKKVINDMKRFKIQYLLINKSIWKRRDNLGFSIYAPMLYEFVLEHYSLEKEMGAYLIFLRRH